MDGELAAFPTYAALRSRSLPFITRYTRYEVLDPPDVRAKLAAATWIEVEDDRGGPRRSATDLGTLTVRAGGQTKQENSALYEPLSLRIVVSRYARSGEAEHGRVVDGWQYELFVVDASAEDWPAPEAVAQFFAQGGQENRFAQEDRELGLDRIFSYHLPGQELACLVGLMCWQVVHGFELGPPHRTGGSPHSPCHGRRSSCGHLAARRPTA